MLLTAAIQYRITIPISQHHSTAPFFPLEDLKTTNMSAITTEQDHHDAVPSQTAELIQPNKPAQTPVSSQPTKPGQYTTIPGPLGLDAASLKGKVALVTGAGA